MNATLASLRQDLEDAATHLGRPHELRFKSMFGGLMVYFEEKPCAWISAQGLALKVPLVDQDALLACEGAARFRHKPDEPPSRDYIVLPFSLCRDTPTLAGWLECSAHAAPGEKRKRPRPKTRP